LNKKHLDHFLNSSYGLAAKGFIAFGLGFWMSFQTCFPYCLWCWLENGLLMSYGVMVLLQITNSSVWVKSTQQFLWNVGWPVGLYHASLQMAGFPLLQKGLQISGILFILGLGVRYCIRR
jgi:hypothetical protein